MKILPRNILAIVYLVLTVFHYHLDKYINGGLYGVLFFIIVFLFFALLFNCLRGAYLYFFRKGDKKLILESLIYGVILVNSLAYPSIVSSRLLEPRVVKRGCYEGTVNHSTLFLRADSTFDIHRVGFFTSQWHTGKWSETGDTLLLSYKDNKPEHLANKYLFADGNWKAIKAENDSQVYIFFYNGYCRGRN